MMRPSSSSSTFAPIAVRKAAVAARRSVSLTRSSAASRISVRPSAHAAATARIGDLVDQVRDQVAADAHAVEPAAVVLHGQVGEGLAVACPLVAHGDGGAHRAEHVEECAARRVDADALHLDVTVGIRRSCDEKERCGREVTRDDPRPRLNDVPALYRDVALPAYFQHVEPEHTLRVVARGDGLDDRRRALGAEAGEEHAALHLRRRHGQRVLDPPKRVAGDLDRRVPVGQLDVGAHLPERVRDARHRTSAQ